MNLNGSVKICNQCPEDNASGKQTIAGVAFVRTAVLTWRVRMIQTMHSESNNIGERCDARCHPR